MAKKSLIRFIVMTLVFNLTFLNCNLLPNLLPIEKKGWKVIKTTGNKPTARYCASSVVYKHQLLIFGGFDSQRTNELHSLNLKTFEWSLIETTGQIPSPRSHHTLFIRGYSLYVFGGLTDDGKLSHDLHCLELDKKEWHYIHTSGCPPQGRLDYAGSLIGHFLFVFGGYDGKVRLNDLFLLNLDTMIWSEPLTYGNIPSKRMGHAVTSVGNMVVLFGGDDGNKHRLLLNDVYTFDLSTMKWTYHEVQGPLPPGRIHASLTTGGNNKLYLFGGSGTHKEKYDDMYTLDISNMDVYKFYSFTIASNKIVNDMTEAIKRLNKQVCEKKQVECMNTIIEEDLIIDDRITADKLLSDKMLSDKSSDDISKSKYKPFNPDFPLRVNKDVDISSKKKSRRKRGSRDSSSKKSIDITKSSIRSRSQSPPRGEVIHYLSTSPNLSPRYERIDIDQIIFDDREDEETMENYQIISHVRHTLDGIRYNYQKLIREKERFQQWRMSEVEKLGKEFARDVDQNAVIMNIQSQQKNKVSLNVGGIIFETSIDVLTSHKDSMLAAMFSGRYKMEMEEEGYYFIDRDGTLFKYILNYLRYGDELLIEPIESLLQEIYQEALFYQLSGLMELVTKKLMDPEFPKEMIKEY